MISFAKLGIYWLIMILGVSAALPLMDNPPSDVWQGTVSAFRSLIPLDCLRMFKIECNAGIEPLTLGFLFPVRSRRLWLSCDRC